MGVVEMLKLDDGWTLVGCDECHAINGQCGECENGGWWHCYQYAEFAGHGKVMCLKCESVKEWTKYD